MRQRKQTRAETQTSKHMISIENPINTERDRCAKITIPEQKPQNPNMNPGSTLKSGPTAAFWREGELQHFAARTNRSNPRKGRTAAFRSQDQPQQSEERANRSISQPGGTAANRGTGQPQHFGRNAAVALPVSFCQNAAISGSRILGPEIAAFWHQMTGRATAALRPKCCGWPSEQNAAVGLFLGLLRFLLAAKCCDSPFPQIAAVPPDLKVLPGFMFGFWSFRTGMVILAHLSLSVSIAFSNDIVCLDVWVSALVYLRWRVCNSFVRKMFIHSTCLFLLSISAIWVDSLSLDYWVLAF